MQKAAIVILAGTEGYEALGRLANALFAAKEFADAGDEVQILFDGAGVQWIKELSDEDHMYHGLFQKIRGKVSGVCAYCSKAFKVQDVVEKEGFNYADEHEGHPSFRTLMQHGFTIITF